MRRRFALAAIVLVLLAGTAAAHVPAFAGDNSSPADAHRVDPPTKSWAIYDSLGEDGVRYYELRLDAGQRLALSLFAPDEGPFRPSMAIMSPAIEGTEAPPDRVTVPDGYGTRVVEGTRPGAPDYEPNTPAANYETAAYGTTVEEGGRYLVAVYEPAGRSGQVGVVAGDRESFTAAQYLGVALDLPRIYLWEGTSPVAVFGPPLATLVGGLAVLRRRIEGHERPLVRGALVASGLAVIGSAAAVFVKMLLVLAETGPSAGAVVTVVFVAVPALLGALVVKLAVDPAFELSGSGRALLAVAGVGSLLTWAGYVVAPLVPLAVALWPCDVVGE